MASVLLALAFFQEIVAFIRFGFSAVPLSSDKILQNILDVCLFAGLIIFWSLFIAPKASRKATALSNYIYKSIIYAVSATVIIKEINFLFGITYILLRVLNELFLLKYNLKK